MKFIIIIVVIIIIIITIIIIIFIIIIIIIIIIISLLLKYALYTDMYMEMPLKRSSVKLRTYYLGTVDCGTGGYTILHLFPNQSTWQWTCNRGQGRLGKCALKYWYCKLGRTTRI